MAPPVSLPTRVTSRSPQPEVLDQGGYHAGDPGDAQVGSGAHRRQVRAERQVGDDAPEPAGEPVDEIVPDPAVLEQAVQQDQGQAGAGVAIVDGALLRDAPAALGAARWQELNEQYGLGLIRNAVQNLIDTGVLSRQPATPLARLLLGALTEAARYVASSDDPGTATEECVQALGRMLDGLRR